MGVNRYGGRCRRCAGWVEAQAGLLGPKIDGRWTVEHDGECPVPRAASSAPAYASGRNRRPAPCDSCGERVAAGEGSLVHCIEDSGCMQHHDESGWHVYCLDRTACDARRATAISEQREHAARIKRVDDARRTVTRLVRRVEYSRQIPTVIGAAPSPTVETISLGSRAGGSETLYLCADGTARYIESSCDDYSEWIAPVTDALVSAIHEYDEAMQLAT